MAQIDPRHLKNLLAQARRPALPPGWQGQRAAVFVLLVNRERQNLLLIRRADRGDRWSGQIAFPGGRIDPGDAGALQAAYRETSEEVGIEAGAITYLGELGHFQTGTDVVDLHAFCGLWDGAETSGSDPAEVAQVMEVPLADLAGEHHRRGFRARSVEELGGGLIYPLGETSIWGVTARIVHFLLELIAEAQDGPAK